jgi:hypothetical protein
MKDLSEDDLYDEKTAISRLSFCQRMPKEVRGKGLQPINTIILSRSVRSERATHFTHLMKKNLVKSWLLTQVREPST